MVVMAEATFGGCINCTYLGTRDDGSKFCMIPGKKPSDKACDQYKSVESAIAERKELTKLRKAVQFIQTYCETHRAAGCKGCRFGYGYDGCPLAQSPERWNTDCLM